MCPVVAIVKDWRVRLGLAIVVATLLVLGVLFVRSALAARTALVEGREALEEGRRLLLEGDAAGAASSFESARLSFLDASSQVRGPSFRVAGWMPVVGRTPDTLGALAAAGVRVSAAGSTLAGAVAEIGGISALAPSGGRIPVEVIEELAPAVASAEADVASAFATLGDAPDSLLLGPVGPARDDAEVELQSLHDLLATSSSVLDGLPALLGADGPRNYFFGAQNPAELRGSGGVMGAYSILTITDGELEFSRFRPVQSLPELKVKDVPPPAEEYSRNYDQFRGGGRFWLSINATPDFPTAAEVLLDAYEVAERDRLDGAILADPFMLQALMRITGPATVPGLDLKVAAEDIVAFTTNEAYALLPNKDARKRLLGAVAEGVVASFLERGDLDTAELRMLVRTASEGHLLVYSRDAAIQAALARTGAGGALHADTNDLLLVAENSAGGNKVDFYQDRSLDYEVWLQSDGSARATVTLTFDNGAPTSGPPKYVLGPFEGFSEAGESNQIVSVYCGIGCRLIRAERDGERIGVGQRTELGHRFFRDQSRTPSGDTTTLELTWYLPSAWEGGSLGGSYELTVLNRPTIRPDSAVITVHAPEGMDRVEADPGMTAGDGSATWKGTLKGPLTLAVRFSPPPLVRWWRLLTPG